MAQIFIDPTKLASGSSAGWTRYINSSGTLSVAAGSPNTLDLVSSAAGTKVFGYDALNSVQDNLEILVKFRFSSDTGKQGIASLRYSGSSEATTKGYTLSGSVISSAGQLAIDEGSTGYFAWTAWNYLANTTYWARFRMDGNRFRAKVWSDGSAEPSSWMIDATDSNTSSGSFNGLHDYNTGTVHYYQVSFGTNGDSAPVAQPSLSITGNARIQRTETAVIHGNAYVANIPPSTPTGIIGGGYGGPGGYGFAYGMGAIPSYVTNDLDIIGNARIERVKNTTIHGNGRVERVNSATIHGNARVERVNSAVIHGNARIQRTGQLTIHGQSRIEKINHLDIVGNATLESYYFSASVDTHGDARIERVEDLSIHGNGRVERVNQAEILGNAAIIWQKQLEIHGNARLIWQKQATIQGNAFIQIGRQAIIHGNAFIQHQNQVAIHGNARIRRTEQLAIHGNATLYRIDHLDIHGNARIERITDIEIIGNAKISNPSPDKRPQTWENAATTEPQTWSDSDDKAAQVWNDSDAKTAAEWSDSDDKQKQQWSDSDNKQPTEWRRQYFD